MLLAALLSFTAGLFAGALAVSVALWLHSARRDRAAARDRLTINVDASRVTPADARAQIREALAELHANGAVLMPGDRDGAVRS